MFLGLTTGYAATLFGPCQPCALVTPFATNAGMKSLARNLSVCAGPTLAGIVIGVSLFGDSSELWNLVWNGRKFSGEFRSLRNELYYN